MCYTTLSPARSISLPLICPLGSTKRKTKRYNRIYENYWRVTRCCKPLAYALHCAILQVTRWTILTNNNKLYTLSQLYRHAQTNRIMSYIVIYLNNDVLGCVSSSASVVHKPACMKCWNIHALQSSGGHLLVQEQHHIFFIYFYRVSSLLVFIFIIFGLIWINLNLV